MKSNGKIQLNIGSGVYLRGGYINIDLYDYNEIKAKQGIFCNAKIENGAEYIQCDITKGLPFPDDYADYVEMFDVIEHLGFNDLQPTLEDIRRVMKPGAKLVIATANMDALALDWLQMGLQQDFDWPTYATVMQGIFGNQVSAGEFHRCPINPRFLDALMANAGFRDGKMWLVPKNSPAPMIGTLKPPKKSITRYEVLIAEVFK